ncbi:hypothetical protein [Bacillus sp. mrc49]|uniref:hypothetical protein n=1 Tax=Bacillus sp. mrc49 TaxID=2054913 RepID=UPI000C26FFDC|nr:hypothetical protein [Bacillus sp. mrc49]PJN87236.1 hypothetical protein CVN76_29875 [Bacillus sp. mrc49]
MASIVYTAILISSIIFLARKNVDKETYFPLKIFGYFILGSFTFHLNQISLPLGFIVYLIFFRPKLNVQGKRIAAVFGFSAFIIVQWMIPYVIDGWENRPISMEHELGSVYTVDFQEENERVMRKLNVESSSLRLDNFEVDYTEDGSITDLSWKLGGQNDDGYTLYQIEYDMDKNRYHIMKSQLETGPHSNQSLDAERFFKNLSVLDIKDITHAKGDFTSYVIKSTGERIHYSEGKPTHIISEGEIKLVENDQVPIEGYIISTFAMKKTGEKRNDRGNISQESFESTESSEYLLDVNAGEK